MPDPRFYSQGPALTLAEVAAFCGGTLADPEAGARQIASVAPLALAGPEYISFLVDMTIQVHWALSNAGACLITPKLAEQVSAGKVGPPLVICPDPKAAYIQLAQQHGIDPGQMALAFVTAQPFVTSNIIGATNLEQLSNNLASIELTLSAEVLAGIEQIHRQQPNPAP